MLSIKGLTVKFPSRFGDFTAIEDVHMTIKPGEIHGLVGESGAGQINGWCRRNWPASIPWLRCGRNHIIG